LTSSVVQRPLPPFTACRSTRCLTDLRIAVTLSSLARGRFVRVLRSVAEVLSSCPPLCRSFVTVSTFVLHIFYVTSLQTVLHLLINYLSYWITVVDVGQISRTKSDNIYAGVQLPPSLVSRRNRQLVTIYHGRRRRVNIVYRIILLSLYLYYHSC